MRVDLFKTFHFEAAHKNPLATGTAARLHGHSYRVDVQVAGVCDPHLGWLIDYAEVSAQFDPIRAQIDHRYLNDLEGLDTPTLRNLAGWIRERLQHSLGFLANIHVGIVGSCAFQPASLPPDAVSGVGKRIRYGFEAAHRLPNLPEGHKCRQLHGHSFMVDVAAADLTSVDAPMRLIYDTLDHTCLNDIAGLENATSENVSRWIWDRLAPRVPTLEAVVVAETCTARCVYRGV